MSYQFQAAHGVDDMDLPLSGDTIRTMQDENEDGKIHAYVIINVDDIIEGDIDVFDEIVSEKITGTICLQDIGFKAVDVTEDGYEIVFEVKGFIDDDDLESYFD